MVENAGANESSIRTYLERNGGSVQDPGGRGLTDEMARQLGIDRPAALSGVLAQLESDGVITREMRGLRTFRIALASSKGAIAPPAPPVPAVAASAPAPVDASSASSGRAVSLRDAISRQTMSVSPAAPPPAAPAVADAEQAPVVAPYVRSRFGATGAPAASGAVRPAPPSAPPISEGSTGGAVSLRDALAAGASGPAAASRFTSLRDGGFPTSPPPGPLDPPPFERTTPGYSGIAPERTNDASGREKRKGGGLRRSREKLALSALDVKAEPTRMILGAFGLTVVGLIIITVITVFVAKGSSQKVITPGVTSSSTDACNVVTADMATTAFGGTDAGPPNFVLGDCVYGDGIVHELIVQVFRQDAKSLFDTGRTSSAQSVPDLGDDAYYVDGGLRIVKGSSLLEITLGPTPTATPTPALLTLAASAVARLGP